MAELADYERWCECAVGAEDRALLARVNDERNPGLAEGIDALHRDGRKLLAAVGALHMTVRRRCRGCSKREDSVSSGSTFASMP